MQLPKLTTGLGTNPQNSHPEMQGIQTFLADLLTSHPRDAFLTGKIQKAQTELHGLGEDSGVNERTTAEQLVRVIKSLKEIQSIKGGPPVGLLPAERKNLELLLKTFNKTYKRGLSFMQHTGLMTALILAGYAVRWCQEDTHKSSDLRVDPIVQKTTTLNLKNLLWDAPVTGESIEIFKYFWEKLWKGKWTLTKITVADLATMELREDDDGKKIILYAKNTTGDTGQNIFRMKNATVEVQTKAGGFVAVTAEKMKEIFDSYAKF